MRVGVSWFETFGRTPLLVLQMGAEFIGCLIMEAMVFRGVKWTVMEMGDRMVSRMTGPTPDGMIKDWREAKGVKVFTGTNV